MHVCIGLYPMPNPRVRNKEVHVILNTVQSENSKTVGVGYKI